MSHANPLQLHCRTRRELSASARLPPISTRFPSSPPFNSLPLPLPLPLPAPGMEYQNLDADSNVVDDDFPMQNTTWNASNMQFSALSKDPPLALPWVDDLTSESQMHSLETEAYSAVLSAFHAQSDRLTWERESLLSELRKELRVSDVEHREFLLKFKSENSVKMIRECHDNVVRQQRVLSNTMKAPLKKQKIAHVPVSSSPRCLPCPPSTAATIFPSAKTAHVPASSSPHCLPPPPSTAATIFPLALSWDYTTNAAYAIEILYLHHSWPLNYSVTSVINWTVCGHDFRYGNLGPGLKPAALTRQPSSIVKDKSSLVVEMKKGPSNVGIEASNRCGDLVHILPTDKLITEIETILRENPNPWQVQKVKLILGEHERSLRDALQKLDDVSIEDDSPDHLLEHDFCLDVQQFGHASFNPIFVRVDGGKGLLY